MPNFFNTAQIGDINIGSTSKALSTIQKHRAETRAKEVSLQASSKVQDFFNNNSTVKELIAKSDIASLRKAKNYLYTSVLENSAHNSADLQNSMIKAVSAKFKLIEDSINSRDFIRKQEAQNQLLSEKNKLNQVAIRQNQIKTNKTDLFSYAKFLSKQDDFESKQSGLDIVNKLVDKQALNTAILGKF